MGGRLCKAAQRRRRRGLLRLGGGPGAQGRRPAAAAAARAPGARRAGAARERRGPSLTQLPEEQVAHIVSCLDLAAFAGAAAPACRQLAGVVGDEAFEGWLCEIQRLLRSCPWTPKPSFESILSVTPGLQAKLYRSTLLALDREFVASGQQVISAAARPRRAVVPPAFFDFGDDALAFVCKACKSFVAPVAATAGRGTMGHDKAAFILQPTQTLPFCCAVQETRQTCLSTGTYILQDAACVNGGCDASLGWKYQACVPVGGLVPQRNRWKVGQFWLFAEALEVVSPSSGAPGCCAEQFYLSGGS